MKLELLERLFPDTTVRKVVERVSTKTKAYTEEMENDYDLLNSSMKVLRSVSGAACFGSLSEYFCDHEDTRYLRYRPDPYGKLKISTRERWVELCQELGLVGAEQSPREIVSKNGVVIDLQDHGLYVGKLYMQLCLLRWLREAPVLVENVIDLVDNAGRDFWAAVAYCHAHNVPNVDHSLLPYGSIYPVSGWDKTALRDFALVLRLHQATVNPDETDDRQAADALKDDDGFLWNWHKSTVRPPKKFILKEREMLLSGELFPIIGASSWEEAAAKIKQLKKRKSSVEFEDSNSK